MGCGSIYGCLLKIILFFLIFALALIFIPNLPPHASFQDSFKPAPFKPFAGSLALNERLENVETWGEAGTCPESYAAFEGELYGGLLSGEVVKFTGEKVTTVVRTGRTCRGNFEERICGRPLGLQFDKNGALYVADAYYGILKVDVKTGKKEIIVSPDTKIDGKEPKVFNALALASNGDIYWSDSSTDFLLEDGLFAALADASGRLIHYNAKSKQNKVLIDKVHFANGVVLSEDESVVLVADLFRARILRYYLKGTKAGTYDVFIDGLPGFPDNINYDGKGGYLIPLVTAGDPEHPLLTNMLGPFPLVRKFLARLMGVTQMVFETIDRAYPNEFCLKAIHFIGHFTMADPLTPNHRVSILHLSKTGEILDSIHTTTKPLSVCEAFIHKDTLYLGSPFDPYRSRVKLSDVGWVHLAQVETKQSGGQGKHTATPVKKDKAQKQATTPLPQEESSPSTKQTAPSPNEKTSPPNQETLAPEKNTPPPRKQTLNPNQETAQQKQTGSSPKVQKPVRAQPKKETSQPKRANDRTKTVPVMEDIKTI